MNQTRSLSDVSEACSKSKTTYIRVKRTTTDRDEPLDTLVFPVSKRYNDRPDDEEGKEKETLSTPQETPTVAINPELLKNIGAQSESIAEKKEMVFRLVKNEAKLSEKIKSVFKSRNPKGQSAISKNRRNSERSGSRLAQDMAKMNLKKKKDEFGNRYQCVETVEEEEAVFIDVDMLGQEKSNITCNDEPLMMEVVYDYYQVDELTPINKDMVYIEFKDEMGLSYDYSEDDDSDTEDENAREWDYTDEDSEKYDYSCGSESGSDDSDRRRDDYYYGDDDDSDYGY